jgi:hypothetical protein
MVMNFRSLLLSGLVLTASASVPASAEFCAADTVPAATLLLPYFEVDLANPAGKTTLFSINNALASAGLAKVTLWTDWAIPTLSFDVYLTGYDVQTINLRDIFNGVLPVTADAGRDPADTISPRGVLSQDVSLASCAGVLPYSNPVLSALLKEHLRASHTGERSPIYNRCVGEPHTGPALVRGYVTVDAAKGCSLDFPSDPNYFRDVASRENRFWGTVIYLDPANNSAQQESLVHIEACDPGDLTKPCPTGNGSYTFYGALVGFDGSDDREPLPSAFASSFFSGGTFDGGSSLLVWRDTKTAPGPPATWGTNCGNTFPNVERPAWMPLTEREVAVFDEQENPGTSCMRDNTLPTPPYDDVCLSLASQRIPVGGFDTPTYLGISIATQDPFGWLRLDLNHGTPGSPQGERAQGWVIAINSAAGRYSTGVEGIAFDSACSPALPETVFP